MNVCIYQALENELAMHVTVLLLTSLDVFTTTPSLLGF